MRSSAGSGTIRKKPASPAERERLYGTGIHRSDGGKHRRSAPVLHHPQQKAPPRRGAKRRWLVDRLPEGHVFRKLDVKEKVFIEYAPLETAWVPVEGDNYLYLYCLWVAGAYKDKGYGRALMEHCLADARDRENPASACWGRKNRRPGSPTSPSPGSTALRRWMKRAMATPCWPDPSTVPPPLYGPSQGGDHRGKGADDLLQ